MEDLQDQIDPVVCFKNVSTGRNREDVLFILSIDKNNRLRSSCQKPGLSYADQVAKLVSRGLTVADQPAVERILSHVNYSRFNWAQHSVWE